MPPLPTLLHESFEVRQGWLKDVLLAVVLSFVAACLLGKTQSRSTPSSAGRFFKTCNHMGCMLVERSLPLSLSWLIASMLSSSEPRHPLLRHIVLEMSGILASLI